MKNPFLLVLVRVIVVFALLIGANLCFAEPPQVEKGKVPAWVKDVFVKRPPNIPANEVSDGIYYLLLDHQFKVRDEARQQSFHHFAEYIVNEHGLERSSQINISFDPSYQQLTFHTLRLWRDGKLIDKLSTTRFSLLQREKDMERLIYDGRLSANAILDDVRIGDIVEYSYSIDGANPVYGGIFSHDFYTQWSVPVHHQYVRILWERAKSLAITRLKGAPAPQVVDYGKGKEYLFEQQDIAALKINSQVPGWFDPYGEVILTSGESWAEIVHWANPLYSDAVHADDDIDAIAAKIRAEHETTDTQIVAALEFVQKQIRYLGLEMGMNSHRPSPAGETLQRRYGDCKDKAVLLISLLKALNIPAQPALVNTSSAQEIYEFPPSPTDFDHVIVHLNYQGKEWWLDPTRQNQRGKLTDIYQPDYGYALIVAAGETGLTKMLAERDATQVISEVFDLSEGAKASAHYTVSTHYYSVEAESQRSKLARSSHSDIADQYFNYYKKSYPGIVIDKPLTVVDAFADGSLETLESYDINDIWQKRDDPRYVYLDFYANSIGDNLTSVDEVQRNSPFSLRYPNHIVQKIEVRLPANNWNFSAEQVTENNPFFKYHSQVSFDQDSNVLTLSYEYEALQDHVPVDQLSVYMAARKKAASDTTYSIQDLAGLQDNISEYKYWIIGALVYIALIVFAVMSWQLDKRRKECNARAVFYPVSLFKVIALSLFTLGIYTVYWSYQNWVYIRRVESYRLSPFWRSLFHPLWFYPLARRVVLGKEAKQRQLIPASLSLLAVLAVIYLALNIAAAQESYVVLASLLSCVVVWFVALQVNEYIQPDASIFVIHSRWRLRHLALVLVFAPFLALVLSEDYHFLPSDEVVAGDYLTKRDVRFMQRHQIIQPNEIIQYFYSDALWDLHADGNGLTQDHVFSYWKDEEDNFHTETAALKEIDHYEIKNDVSGTGKATVTFFREDGTSFFIYLALNGGGNKKFETKLAELWRAERMRQELEVAFGEAKDGSDKAVNLARKHVEDVISLALLDSDVKAQAMLAQLYSRGALVKKNTKRAIHFYERAYDGGSKKSGLDLAWHLAITAPSPSALERSIKLASEAIDESDTYEKRQVLAAAYAAKGNFSRAIAEQQRAISLAGDQRSAAMQDRLTQYQKHLPWTQLWSEQESVQTPALRLKSLAPKYPTQAARKGIEGKVSFKFDVLANGEIANITVASAEPEGYFETAGREALKQFIYLPALVDGKAVDTKGVINRFVFELED